MSSDIMVPHVCARNPDVANKLKSSIPKLYYGKYLSSNMMEEVSYTSEFDVPVPGIPGIGNFSFFWWYRNRYRKKLVPEKSLGTGIGKIWYRKKVSEPVSEKFSTGKKSRNRYRKNLVPEKSLGTGIKYIWYRKKFSANFAILLSLSQ